MRLVLVIFLEKVYFIGCIFDVKLQADNPVRWDVAERLNHKQKIQKVKHYGIQIYRRRMGEPRKKLRRRPQSPTPRTMAKATINIAY